ncbi:MAG: hypothetical protein ACOC5T_08245 [Elusimicrobiota bacterium]
MKIRRFIVYKMAAGGDFLNKIIPDLGGGFISMTISILLGTIVLGLCGGGLWFWIKRKKNWNMKVEFRLPRSIQVGEDENGNEIVSGTIRKEWGKGFYDAEKGVVYIKRKKKKATVMKPFNIKEFLSDNNILTVIQVGVDDYRPVLEDSYLNVKDYKTGEEAALIKAKIDTSESQSWKK